MCSSHTDGSNQPDYTSGLRRETQQTVLLLLCCCDRFNLKLGKAKRPVLFKTLRGMEVHTMKCKDKTVYVDGVALYPLEPMPTLVQLRCIVTNDGKGKTLSVDDGRTQFTIPFERIEDCLK